MIREASRDEVDEISNLIHLANREFVPSPMPPGWRGPWSGYWREIADVKSRLNKAQVIVAERGGKIVGTVTFYPESRLAEPGGIPPDWPGIRLLAVAPDARGTGTGKALMLECLERARSIDATTVGLYSMQKQMVAQRIYEQLGFRRVPELDYWPVPEICVMAFRLDL